MIFLINHIVYLEPINRNYNKMKLSEVGNKKKSNDFIGYLKNIVKMRSTFWYTIELYQ